VFSHQFRESSFPALVLWWRTREGGVDLKLRMAKKKGGYAKKGGGNARKNTKEKVVNNNAAATADVDEEMEENTDYAYQKELAEKAAKYEYVSLNHLLETYNLHKCLKHTNTRT